MRSVRSLRGSGGILSGLAVAADGAPEDRYPFDERPEILPLIPTNAISVLDVGCGRGGFGRLLRRSGRASTIWALEQSEIFGQEAAKYYDNLINGKYPEALAGQSVSFDCIVFNDVLEHMVDPWDALRQAQDFLNPGGSVVASIPNVRNARTVFDLVARGNWTYVDMGVLDRTHLRFFTKSSLCSLFDGSGYQVEEVRGVHSLGRSHFLLGRVLPRVIGSFAYNGFGIRARPMKNR